MEEYFDRNFNSEIVEHFLQDLYMDDRAPPSLVLKEMMTCLIFICVLKFLNEGGFNLGGWRINGGLQIFRNKINNKINEYESKYFGESHSEKKEIYKILGVSWNIDCDESLFNLKEIIEEALSCAVITKKVVLKVISSIFDPLGILWGNFIKEYII